MTIKIYKIDASPPVRAVLMTAQLLKLDVEQIDINIMAEEHMSPEYLEKNPMHCVPLLEDGDFILADSHAIITYLVSKYGGDLQAKLYPSELNLRATIDQRLFFDTSFLFPAIKKIVAGILGAGATSATKKQLEEVNGAYEIVEKYLQKSKFVAGDHLTVADVSVLASISTLNVFLPVDAKYTKLNEWRKPLEQEEWYKKGNLPGLNVAKQFLAANWNTE